MQNPNSHGYWVLGLAMSVDLQDIPAVQSKYVCANSLAMSVRIELSEVVVWREVGQLKAGGQESRLPCLAERGTKDGGKAAVGANERMRAEAEQRFRNSALGRIGRLTCRFVTATRKK